MRLRELSENNTSETNNGKETMKKIQVEIVFKNFKLGIRNLLFDLV